MQNKFLKFFAAFSLCTVAIFSNEAMAKKLSIVTTNFPSYDIARHVAGDKANIIMLLKPGSDMHSYEPSVKDINAIRNADLFYYTGGENDTWVESLLESFDKSVETLEMLDCVKTLEEEQKEGMMPEDEDNQDAKGDDEVEIDEHVWTSPLNDITLINTFEDKLSSIDPTNKAYYQKNAKAYADRFVEVDKTFKDIVSKAKRKTIIVGDRFPLLYFARTYGLDYFAAFKGCSDQVQASAKTISFLIDKVNTLKVPVIFKIEFSNGKIANSIAADTNTKVLELNTCHNITPEQFKQKVEMVELFKTNFEPLKQALY